MYYVRIHVVVVVVVVDLYSASRSASNALIAPIALRKDEFSEPIWSCRYTEQGPGRTRIKWNLKGK